MSTVVLNISFLKEDKKELSRWDFKDNAAYALGDEPMALASDDIFERVCDRYFISRNVLNNERYQVIKDGSKEIRIVPRV